MASENIRVKMTFCDEDWCELDQETWKWTEMNPTLARPLHQWIGALYAAKFGAEKPIKQIVINQVSVHEKDTQRAPLGLLRDNDAVRVRMAVTSQVD